MNETSGFQHARRRDTFLPGGVHQLEFQTPYRTRVVIEGPMPQVFAAVDRYYAEWPQEGYGTRQVACLQGATSAKYVLERWQSCD